MLPSTPQPGTKFSTVVLDFYDKLS